MQQANIVVARLTNGFGNNLFQYIAGRQLAEYHHSKLIAIPPSPEYYAIPDLSAVGVDLWDFKEQLKAPPTGVIQINEKNYKEAFSPEYTGYNFELRGYFEEYSFYKDNIEAIKSWFPAVEKRPDNDLIIHLRAGDRLFYKKNFHLRPTIKNYLNAISQFDFGKMHIVTDMKKWAHITKEELENTSFHVDVPRYHWPDLQQSADYFNGFIDGLAKFDPIINRGKISEDFNYIRTFDNILFEHGTLSWWASITSNANCIGVYGPWRSKDHPSKNLSQVDREGWFQWQ